MPNPLRLEIFEASVPDGSTVTLQADALEDVRLTAFEQGYKAGWDDAVKASAEEQAQLRADLGRNLQSLSFTYEDAHRHVLAALGPLLQEMAATVLPKLARDTLGAAVVEALMPIAETASRPPVTLLIAPSSRPVVEAALKDTIAPPLDLVEEPTLGEAQALLRFDSQELRIDLDAALARISAAVSAFLATDGAAGPAKDAGSRNHGPDGSQTEMTDGRAIA